MDRHARDGLNLRPSDYVSSLRLAELGARQLALHLSRTHPRRCVHELIRIGRYTGAHDCHEPETVFKHEYRRSGLEDVQDLPARTSGPVWARASGVVSPMRSESRNGNYATTKGALDGRRGAVRCSSCCGFRPLEPTGLSRSTIWRPERQGAFPRYHRISAKPSPGSKTRSPIGSDHL